MAKEHTIVKKLKRQDSQIRRLCHWVEKETKKVQQEEKYIEDKNKELMKRLDEGEIIDKRRDKVLAAQKTLINKRAFRKLDLEDKKKNLNRLKRINKEGEELIKEAKEKDLKDLHEEVQAFIKEIEQAGKRRNKLYRVMDYISKKEKK